MDASVVASLAGFTVSAMTTLLTGASAGAAGKLAEELGKGILQNFSYDVVKRGHKAAVTQLGALRAGEELPANHDLFRALRLSQIDAARYIGTTYVSTRWHADTDVHRGNAATFDESLEKWCTSARERATAPTLAELQALASALETAGKDAWGESDTMGPDVQSTQSALHALWNGISDSVLAELRRASVPVDRKGFIDFFKGDALGGGFVAAAQQFFMERLKTDPRVFAAFFVLEQDRQDKKLTMALQQLTQIDEVLSARFAELEAKLAELTGMVVGLDLEGRLDRLLALATESNLDEMRAALRAELRAVMPHDEWRGSLVAVDVATRVRELSFHGRARADSGDGYLVPRFFGRRDVLADLDSWLDMNEKGLLVVCAPSGGGKSALIAEWSARRRQRDDIVARHFVSHQFPSTTTPTAALQHLLVQLRELNEGPEAEGRAQIPSTEAELLDAIHRRLQCARNDNRRLIVIIDALDELDDAFRDTFVRLDLGAGNFVVVSQRAIPGEEPPSLRQWLRAEVAPGIRSHRIDIPLLSDVDLLEWMRIALPGYTAVERRTVLADVRRISGGVPLFAQYLIESLTDTAAGAALNSFSATFAGFLRDYIDGVHRETPFTDGDRLLLAILTTVRVPIVAHELSAVWARACAQVGLPRPTNTDRFERRVERWLSRRPLGAENGRSAEVVQFEHPRLGKEFEGVIASELLEAASEALLAWCRSAWQPARSLRKSQVQPGSVYPLQQLPAHMIDAGLHEEAGGLLSNLNFVEQRFARLGGTLAARAMGRDFRLYLSQIGRVPISAERESYERHARFWSNVDTRVAELASSFVLDTLPFVRRTMADVGLIDDSTSDRALLSETFSLPSSVAVLPGHTGAVRGALELSDARLLSWSWDGTLRLWSAEGEEERVLRGHTDAVYGALALGDGRLLSWSSDSTLRLWSSDGDLEFVLSDHAKAVVGALALGDGRLLSWSEDGTLRLWSSAGRDECVLCGHAESVVGALELGDGRLLSWSDDGALRLWSSRGDEIRVLTGHTASVVGALELSDGRILSWSWDCTLRLWSAVGEEEFVILGHAGAVVGSQELGDGRLLAWSRDGTLRLWSALGVEERVLQIRAYEMTGALVLGDGRLLSWSDYGPLRLWSAAGDEERVMVGHAASVEGALALSDGQLLSWSFDGSLRLWSATGYEEGVLHGHTGPVAGALELTDRRLLSWSQDGTLRLWSPAGEEERILPGQANELSGALVLGDGRLLSWGDDGTLRLWSAAGEERLLLLGHTGSVQGALELADGRLLSWSWDGTLRLWSSAGEEERVLRGHTGAVVGALAHTDGRLLSWSRDGTLRLWSATGDERRVLSGHANEVRGAQALGDGRLLSWSSDGTLRLWSAEGEEYRVLQGHAGIVRGAQALGDGRLLSWSSDGTLRLWSATGHEERVLTGNTGDVVGARPLADGSLLSWGWDGSLQLWSANWDQMRVLAGHGRVVEGVLELQDGRLLSWSWDGSMRMWSKAGAAGIVLSGHADAISGAQSLENGWLLSWSWDGTVRVWSAAGECLDVWWCVAGPVRDVLDLGEGRFLVRSSRSLHLIRKFWR